MDWEEEHGRDVDALDVHDLELQKSNKISSISQKTSVFFSNTGCMAVTENAVGCL